MPLIVELYGFLEIVTNSEHNKLLNQLVTQGVNHVHE